MKKINRLLLTIITFMPLVAYAGDEKLKDII